MIRGTPVENSVGILIICYISFRTINFLCFLSYSFPVLRYRVIRRGRRLNRLLYILYYNSHNHIETL
jgi:hypothetical protein